MFLIRFSTKKIEFFLGKSPVLTLFYLKSQIFRQFLLFFDHFDTKYGQICQSKSGELSKNDHLFFWKNLHFDDVITDDVILLFWGVKWLKMLFFNRFRAKNGHIWKRKPWELSKSGQLFLSRFSIKIFPKFLVLGGRPLLPLKINFIVEGWVIGQMKGNFMPRKKVNWSKVVRPRF